MIMDTASLINKAKDLLGESGQNFTTPEPNRLDVMIQPADLEGAARTLGCGHWGYLSAITGLDHPAVLKPAGPDDPAPAALPEGTIEALYHFCEGDAVVTLRVSMPRTNPELPSICGIIPSATLFEREMIEMFGITITGTPCTDHFILPEEWPAGVFPLRKDFAGYPETAQEEKG